MDVKLNTLFTRYHESFSISPGYTANAWEFERSRAMVLESPNQYCGPGFFYTMDAKRNVTRCGVIDDLQTYVARMERQATDVYLNVAVAWWHNESGYQHMREFKQQFKRCLP